MLGVETDSADAASPPVSQQRTRKCTLAKPPVSLGVGAYKSTGCSTEGLRAGGANKRSAQTHRAASLGTFFAETPDPRKLSGSPECGTRA